MGNPHRWLHRIANLSYPMQAHLVVALAALLVGRHHHFASPHREDCGGPPTPLPTGMGQCTVRAVLAVPTRAH